MRVLFNTGGTGYQEAQNAEIPLVQPGQVTGQETGLHTNSRQCALDPGTSPLVCDLDLATPLDSHDTVVHLKAMYTYCDTCRLWGLAIWATHPDAVAAGSAAPGDEEERDSAPEKGKSSGPSARKGKGQIEWESSAPRGERKLREEWRSGSGKHPRWAECLEEPEGGEAGQTQRKREDAITPQNTVQKKALSLLDPHSSYLLHLEADLKTQPLLRCLQYRYPRIDRSGFSR
ncbi:hypothetical protein CB1_000885001 [Camelus ferus]|nr:hypothetical protein CB1_000885001 [Camelus ferus]